MPAIKGDSPITAIRIEAMPHPSLPATGPGLAFYEGRRGDFYLSEVDLVARGMPIELAVGTTTVPGANPKNGKTYPGNVFDGDGSTGWSIPGGSGQKHRLVIPLKSPQILDTPWTIELLFERHYVAGLGYFRIDVTTDNDATAHRLPSDLQRRVFRGADSPSSELRRDLAIEFLRTSKLMSLHRKSIDRLREQLPNSTRTLVFRERDPSHRRTTHRHHRGEYLQPKELVEPRIPSLFASASGTPADRLEFARWLVSEKNPLVGRVTVNRAWREFFGIGIVRTAGDFGTQSEPPSHPQLIDWLDTEFHRHGRRSLKKLHREIVLSSTYRQSVGNGPASDPDNRLLSAFPYRRFDAERIRDAFLSASGLLTRKVGGPSVYPPQPAEVMKMAYGNSPWPTSTGADRNRRSLYTFSKRTAPFAAFTTFDAPSGELCVARRDRSTTPLQALTLLNDAMYIEIARGLADQAVRDVANKTRSAQPRSIAERLFRRLLVREPSSDRARCDCFVLQQPIGTPSAMDAGRAGALEHRRGNYDAMKILTRRQLFQTCGIGLGKISLASMLARECSASESDLGGLHHAAKAKRVIYLFMAGAPSQLDLFDPKPKLTELEGQPIPPSVIAGQRYAFIQPDAAVLSPRFKFSKHGQSDAELADVLPHLSEVVDDLAFMRTVHTDQFNHAPAQIFVNTGSGIPGRPALGSWLSYGIGSDSDDLPGFVVLHSGGNLSGGAAMWSNGFLPGQHQGVPFRSNGDPILNVSTPDGIDRSTQRATLDLVSTLNRKRMESLQSDAINARIEAYELAYRMQARAPELMDFAGESDKSMRLYGLDRSGNGQAYAKNCLLARRMAERGVRFIQLYHSGWDHHSNVEGGCRKQCQAIDQGTAALIKDLKQRGMLDETLVVWGGEFGRTPMVEASAALGRKLGRDHHPQAFSMFMAGGGIRPGQTIGKTDELGFHPVETPIHVHDIQATILNQLGIDHERLTFTYAGRPFRLTDVHGKVIENLVG